jgi:hypothetical protein
MGGLSLCHYWDTASDPGSSDSTVSDYGLDVRSSIPDRGTGFYL